MPGGIAQDGIVRVVLYREEFYWEELHSVVLYRVV